LNEEINLLNEALAIAKLGFPVFPLSSRSKIPVAKSKGFKESTTNEEEIYNMFTENEQANIGLSMAGINYFVLDIDTHGKNKREGIESLEKLLGDNISDLQNVVSSKTANGGLHLFFSYPDNYEVKQRIGFRKSLDVIKNFVVAPGSVVKRKDGSFGTYEIENGNLSEITEAPEWLLDLITAKEQPIQSEMAYTNDFKGSNEYKGKLVLLIEEVVQGVENGTRNHFFARAFGTLIKANMNPTIAVNLCRDWNENYCNPPLTDKELSDVLKSITKREGAKK